VNHAGDRVLNHHFGDPFGVGDIEDVHRDV